MIRDLLPVFLISSLLFVLLILILRKHYRKVTIGYIGFLLIVYTLYLIGTEVDKAAGRRETRKRDVSYSLEASMRQILINVEKWCELDEAEKIVPFNRWVQLPSRLFSNRPPDQTYFYIGGIWLNKERVLEMKSETVQSIKQNIDNMLECVNKYPELYESYFKPMYEKDEDTYIYDFAYQLIDLENEEWEELDCEEAEISITSNGFISD